MKLLPSYFGVKPRMPRLMHAPIFRAAIIATVAACLVPASYLEEMPMHGS
jgi:hypothetical protein